MGSQILEKYKFSCLKNLQRIQHWYTNRKISHSSANIPGAHYIKDFPYVIFSSLLEQVMRTVGNIENHGIKINGEYLSHLRFADDILLISETPGELELLLTKVNEESKKVGLKINRDKAKVMFNT